jgi:hypothetical protein
MNRRELLAGCLAPLARGLDMTCVCARDGLHWTIGRLRNGWCASWKAAPTEEIRQHLKAIHGAGRELAPLNREQLLALHDVHHEGGVFRCRWFSVRVRRPSQPTSQMPRFRETR